jgi:transposase
VVAGYAGHQQVEESLSRFERRRLAQLERWSPMYHWTDRKIRIHAFYCLLGIFCLRYVHRQAKAARADHSVEKLIEELQQIQQFVLLHPRQGEKGPEGPDRAAYVRIPDDDDQGFRAIVITHSGLIVIS